MALAPTTELEAINVLLSTIGESPVNSMASVAGVVDAAIARSTLREMSIQVQEPGWQFNIEENFTLTPDLTLSEINVPANCIECFPSFSDRNLNITVRGTRVYNREEHTYTWNRPIKVNLTLLLEFNELPQAVRHYITIRAARVFQARNLGSATLDGFTDRDETLARMAISRYEAQTGGHNMLTGNPAVARILPKVIMLIILIVTQPR